MLCLERQHLYQKHDYDELLISEAVAKIMSWKVNNLNFISCPRFVDLEEKKILPEIFKRHQQIFIAVTSSTEPKQDF